MAWVPMFALPNIHVTDPVETRSLAPVYAEDERVRSLAARHANFAAYLKQFSTEFGVTTSPSLLMWDDAGPQAHRNTEALAGFRDALALSVVPYSWARGLRYGQRHNLLYSNWFSIYPWMIDKNYEYVVMRNSAVLALHDTTLLRAQTYPGLSQELVDRRDIDQTLHQALLERWKRRFATATPKWDDLKLFRSLNMANIASALPSHGDVTPYDSGRSIALWVSAFEVLAHPGTGVRVCAGLRSAGKSGLATVGLCRGKIWPSVSRRSQETAQPRVLGL
jgi:hypothetical protein